MLQPKREDALGVRRPVGRVQSKSETPLSLYLRLTGTSTRTMARALGVAQRSVEQWGSGRVLPGLVAALEIERVTKGCVPVEAWLGVPIAQELLRGVRAKQPAALRVLRLEGVEGRRPDETRDDYLDRRYEEARREWGERNNGA